MTCFKTKREDNHIYQAINVYNSLSYLRLFPIIELTKKAHECKRKLKGDI